MRPRAVQSLHLIDQGLEPRFVEVALCLEAASGLYFRAGDQAVLLQRIEIIKALAGRPVEPFIRRMFIGPGRAASVSLHDLKDVVHAHEIVRIDHRTLPADQRHWQFRRIDLASVISWLAATVEACGIDIYVLGKRHFRTRCAFAVRTRLEVGAVIAVVVEYTRRFRGAASHLRDESRKGIRRSAGERVRIEYARLRQRSERAPGILGDVVGQIDGVKPVHADEQHVLIRRSVSGGRLQCAERDRRERTRSQRRF